MTSGKGFVLSDAPVELNESWFEGVVGRRLLAYLVDAAILSAFGFVAYAWLLQRHSATRVAALTFLSPVFAVAYGWLLLGEQMGNTQLLGVAGVCLGVYIVNSGGRPRPQTVIESQESTTLTAGKEVSVPGTR